jgi:hypothetical protein
MNLLRKPGESRTAGSGGMHLEVGGNGKGTAYSRAAPPHQSQSAPLRLMPFPFSRDNWIQPLRDLVGRRRLILRMTIVLGCLSLLRAHREVHPVISSLQV